MSFVSMSLTFIVKLRSERNHLNSEAKPKRERERKSTLIVDLKLFIVTHEGYTKAGFLYATNNQTINETNRPLLTQCWVIFMYESSRCKSNQQSYRSKLKELEAKVSFLITNPSQYKDLFKFSNRIWHKRC